MNKLYCLIGMFITCRVCSGQNLVPNGDFENYVNCPNAFNDFYGYVSDWRSPTTGTPDYLNQCTTIPGLSIPANNWGYQQAHSGVGYCGIINWYGPPFPPDYREYIEVPLISPLVSNTCYHLEMYVSLAEQSNYSTSDLSILFSDTVLNNLNDLYAFSPVINNATGFITDTTNWTLISGNYVASGGESFMILGNFLNNATSVTQNTGFGNFAEAYFYIDDVSLTPCTGIEEQNNNLEIKIFPNPVINKLSIAINNNELSRIILYDIASRKLLQQSFINSISINTEQLAKGIYLYEVRNKNEVIKKGKVVKD